jgi:hypothetical protein
MKHKHAALAVAIVAVLSAPVFAQSAGAGSVPVVGSGARPAAPAGATNDINSNNSSNTAGNNVSITSGRGVSTNQSSVAVIPSTQSVVPSANLLPGGVMAPAGSTTVLGGPSGDVSGTQTVTTRYWVNVPANAERNGDFQRWQQLR